MIPLLTIVLGIPLIVALVPLVMESRLIYYPVRRQAVTPENLGLRAERVVLHTTDDVRLDAVWAPAPNEKAAFLFLHGNAGNLSHRLPNVQQLVERGISVLILDYRGYGDSEGSPSEKGLYADARAGWEWLRERRERVFLFGRSLGAAVAIQLAGEVEAEGVIAEAAFNSVRGMALKSFLTAPAALTLRSRFDSVAAVKDIKCPLLSIHGARDSLAPMSMGRAIYDAATVPKRWYEITAAGHNDTVAAGGEEYWETLLDFVSNG